MTYRETPRRVAYVNARIVDAASGLDLPPSPRAGLLTETETIAALGAEVFAGGVPADAVVIDCGGNVLCPGLVDMRAHLREPGEAHKESMESAGRAAVAGGVTSMASLPNTNPVVDNEAAIEFIARRARQAGLAKVYPYAAATVGAQGKDLAEMGLLAEAGAVGFTDGLNPIANARTMVRVLRYASGFDLLVMHHPQEPSLSGGAATSGELATRMGLTGVAREAEIIMLERDMRLVEMSGARYHAAHISTADSVEIVRRAKEKGLRVTCDAAPPYFSLNEQEVESYRTFAKLNPPLRPETDRLAIVQGLKEGVIDAVASDHAPQDQDAKRLPYAGAAAGGIGLETLLPLTLGLVHRGPLGLSSALGLLTSAPARLLGLEAGALKVGAAADLAVIDVDKPWKYDAKKSLSKSKNSPFHGRPMQGEVKKTIVDGRIVFDHDA